MFEHKKLQNIEEYFTPLKDRGQRCVFFYRVNGYNNAVKAFFLKYYEAAHKCGVIIEGKIPNPDEKNLAYYNEIMGMEFRHDVGFITSSLKKWLPRMNERQRDIVAMSIFDMLQKLKRQGKNDNMLKNAYIKFMCWLYYKFERIVNFLGEDNVPKILYDGDISVYELQLLTILSNAGCDVVLLQRNGDSAYRALDPSSQLSYEMELADSGPIPADFNVKWMQEQLRRKTDIQRLYGTPPAIKACTNAWIQGKGFADVLQGTASRGSETGMFYNCFIRMVGVADKLTYLNELYVLCQELKKNKRQLLILENSILLPSMKEIATINRKNYKSQEQMLQDLSANIRYSANIELQRLMIKAFMDIMLEEMNSEGMTLSRLTNKAVYLLCWLKRYMGQLFVNWKLPEIGCVIFLGGCQSENEALFIRFLSRLPLDVLILVPNLNMACQLKDDALYEIKGSQSLPVEKIPMDASDVRVGTVAYHAERELDDLMYQDTGMYRNRQYGMATSITLQTMYEEISILWDQELKYRPNFSVVESVVNVPVIFSKISGVKDGDVRGYWQSIKALLTADTFLIKDVPYIKPTASNPVKEHVAEFIKNGKLQKDLIRNHPSYQYGHLREEIQEHILMKLQQVIDLKLIKGTFETGVEYTIVATVLNLSKELVRMIQRFDFTKKNPKLIYINTTEDMISVEDTILTAFLNLVGFDVLFFVPTGYQNVEKYFNKMMMEEHQLGEYLYDLQVPQFDKLPSKNNKKGQSWREKIFKRGNLNGT